MTEQRNRDKFTEADLPALLSFDDALWALLNPKLEGLAPIDLGGGDVLRLYRPNNGDVIGVFVYEMRLANVSKDDGYEPASNSSDPAMTDPVLAIVSGLV